MEGEDRNEARTATALDRYIGARIRGLRIAQGLSQEKLAEALSVSFQQIQKYERGSNRVSAATLFHIAKEMRVPITDLLPPGEGDVVSRADDWVMQTLAELTPSLSPEGQALLVTMARTLAACRPLRV